jgi:hypothetical protein
MPGKLGAGTLALHFKHSSDQAVSLDDFLQMTAALH